MSAGKEAVCVRERERGREREVCGKASQAEIVIIVIIVIIHSSVQVIINKCVFRTTITRQALISCLFRGN